MANLKELMRMSADDLIVMGAQVGLTFHTGMKKSHMASQLAQSAASGWMDVNAGLMGGVAEDESFGGSFGDASMISDAAHVAQMISGAGYAEAFHHAMGGGQSHHVEAVHSYMNSLGVSADDVWMHMPKPNPNMPTGHFGMLNAYLRDTLSGHQDIMPEIAGHYTGDIMGEYATNKGGIQASYEHLAHMYVDKSQYRMEHVYNDDVVRVATRLANSMGHSFSEVAFSAANGARTSYMSTLPHLGDPSIVGGVAHPRAALNASGLPMGAIGSGINPEYSLTASLTGTPGWSPTSKELHSSISESVKSLASVYRGDTGMSLDKHVYSDREAVIDSASRYADIMDVRERYNAQDNPSYSASTIRNLISGTNDFDDEENYPAGYAQGRAIDPRFRTFAMQNERSPYSSDEYDHTGMWNIGTSNITPMSTKFSADFNEPTSWNSARARRESTAISNFDSIPWRDIENEKSNPVRFHNLEQGSQEWLDFRKQYDITGSTVGGFLGNNSYTRPWAEMVDKIGLSRSKEPNAFQEKMFAAGHKSEEEARIRVSQALGMDIKQTGAITNDNYPAFMYSPDGLIGDDAIWEHKNPERAGKYANLSAGDHPDYMDQVQLGMLVSGRSRALFSQTIAGQTESQWIDKDEGWYDRNRTRLDSVLGRLDAGRSFVRDNSGLPQDELVSGARRAMMGEGIWKDVSQKSSRGFSASAGTENDPFVGSRSSFVESAGNGYVPNFTMPEQNFPAVVGSGNSGTELMAQAVKEGILGAQEENRQKRAGGGTSSTGPEEDADFDDLGNPRGWSRRRFDEATSDGGSGGGRRPPNKGGSFYDDFGRAGGALAAGVAGGSLSSLSGGAMQALMATPWGRIAAVGIGAIQIGNEAAEGLNDFAGTAVDAGVLNPNEYSSMSQGMEMLGANSQQAARLNQTTHSAYNRMLNGDPSAVASIVQQSRGLLTFGDFASTKGDPVALNRLFQQRAQERGYSPERTAGAAEMSGLSGFARGANAPEYAHSNAEEVVQTGRDSDYIDGVSELQRLQGERARVLPSYNVPQAAISHGSGAFNVGADAVAQARIFGSDVANGAKSVYDFIMGEESGGREYGADGQLLMGINPKTGKPSGAKGSMQVTDSTMRDPGVKGVKGIDPTTATPEQRAQFGRDYYDGLVREFNGDQDKAMAAYTDGVGTVKNAVLSKGDNWLTAVPAQAQNRVNAFHKWQQSGGEIQEGATGFTRNGLSYGQTQTVVQVNINAKVNNQQASATVSTPSGQSATQQINMNSSAMQRR